MAGYPALGHSLGRTRSTSLTQLVAGCPALRAPPCIWTFLSSLGRRVFFSNPLKVKSVRRFEGSAVREFNGKAVRQYDSSAVRLFESSTEQQFGGSFALGSSRTIEPSNARTTEPIGIPILWNGQHD